MTELPYGNRVFDTVVCAHTLEHMKDYKKALAELRRVCSRRLMMIVPKQREYQYTFDLHLHFFLINICYWIFSIRKMFKYLKLNMIGYVWKILHNTDGVIFYSRKVSVLHSFV